MMEDTLNSPMHTNPDEKKNRLKPPENLVQSLEIEKYRLNFLHRCKYRKRPPQSLRLGGCNGIPKSQKLTLLSKMESETILLAISNKKKVISEINRKLVNYKRTNSNTVLEQLTEIQRKRWINHFNKKINFYKSQEKKKWKDWPSKSTSNKRKKIKKQDKKKKQIKRLADIILERKQVINLTDYNIPPEAIVVLSKGLGFVRSPKCDIEKLRLDARKFTNKLAVQSLITNSMNNNTEDATDNTTNNTSSSIPKKLKQINYQVVKPHANDSTTINVINQISRRMDSLNPNIKPKGKENLSKLEIEGLNWLQEMVSEMKIIIDSADKGGAILIYPPALAKKKIMEKVNNKNLFIVMRKDPSEEFINKLLELWKIAKTKGFVTNYEAHAVVGLTSNNNKSTSSHFKAGETYFNPSLKIHKMELEDIKPGCDPPARLITCLQNGVTNRSDVFIANEWLKPLQKDFCKDVVNDSVDVLNWLELMDAEVNELNVKNIKPFTFDFAALYDSITPKLVKEAIRFAIRKCRPGWNKIFTDWIIDMISLSMSAGFAKIEDKWYQPKTGIPTGGNLSVQLANITVYYAMHKCLFSKTNMKKNILSTIRFIDDGSGIYRGSEEEFNNWRKEFTNSLGQFDLTIKEEDWDVALKPGDMVHILDIKYGFDINGKLVTDLYRKETDSRGYLNFTSYHPNHVFSGIVYSQALRLKRIINNEATLYKHLDELKKDFRNAKYPIKLIENIIEKVKAMPRSLEKKTQQDNTDSVILTGTFGTDEILCDVVNEACKPSSINVKYVSETGPKLRNQLSNLKYVSLGSKYGCTKPCGQPRCNSCPLMSGKDKISTNNKTFRTSKGNCKIRNFIYGATCNICSKNYVGKSTQPCHKRINGHRHYQKKYSQNQDVLNDNSSNTERDKYSLATHLHKAHGIIGCTSLDDNYIFTILEKCTPKSLDVKEHLWIQKLRTVTPLGLNLNSPLGIPLI